MATRGSTIRTNGAPIESPIESYLEGNHTAYEPRPYSSGITLYVTLVLSWSYHPLVRTTPDPCIIVHLLDSGRAIDTLFLPLAPLDTNRIVSKPHSYDSFEASVDVPESILSCRLSSRAKGPWGSCTLQERTILLFHSPWSSLTDKQYLAILPLRCTSRTKGKTRFSNETKIIRLKSYEE